MKMEIIVHYSLSSIPENPWKNITEMLEYECAVKWIAIEARNEDGLIGFMHVIRHPEKAYEWWFCDVHTIEKYRRQGVASELYKEALNLLCRYEKACRVTGSVKCDNIASIKLHEKMGFYNTHEKPDFLDFTYEDGEEVFEHYFLQEFPARNIPRHRNILEELACDNKEELLKELDKTTDQNARVFLVWAGETPVGYRIYDKKTNYHLLPEWKEHLNHKCLKIWSYKELIERLS